MQQRDYKTNIRWTWQQLEGMRFRILANCLIGMLRICISLSFVWVCKVIVDVATTRQGEHIWWWIAVMCGIILLMVIASAWNTRVREKSRIIITNRLREKLFSRVMKARWHGREALHSGDTVNRLEEDIRTINMIDITSAAVKDPKVLVLSTVFTANHHAYKEALPGKEVIEIGFEHLASLIEAQASKEEICKELDIRFRFKA